MNLLGDFIGVVQRRLTTEGVAFDPAAAQADPIHFLASYLEFEARRIDSAPRTVRFSTELQASPEWITHHDALQRLAELCRLGQTLAPYQSKQIRSIAPNDLLLADWNIQHLHLGSHVAGHAFADRTGPLLYATFLSDEAYFIAVMDHSSFSAVRLLEILDANWPVYLDHFTLSDVTDVALAPSSSDVKKLRRAGIQSVVRLPSGRVIAPPGGGYTTARISALNMMKAQSIARLLRKAEQYVRDHDTEIRSQLSVGPNAAIRLAALEPGRIVFMSDHADLRYTVPLAE